MCSFTNKSENNKINFFIHLHVMLIQCLNEVRLDGLNQSGSSCSARAEQNESRYPLTDSFLFEEKETAAGVE